MDTLVEAFKKAFETIINLIQSMMNSITELIDNVSK